MMDPKVLHDMQTHLAELELRCTPVEADAKVVVIKTPPQKRFD